MVNDEDAQSVNGYSSCPQYAPVSLHIRRVNISRPVYDQESFDRQFVCHDANCVDSHSKSTRLRNRLRSLLPGYYHLTPGDIYRRLVRYVPVIEHLRKYRWTSWLLRDIVAGLSSGVIHVPQVSSPLNMYQCYRLTKRYAILIHTEAQTFSLVLSCNFINLGCKSNYENTA